MVQDDGIRKGEQMEYRFLKEYANHKRRQIWQYAFLNEQEAEQKSAWLDTILTAIRRGMLTLDEGMREISKL